MEFKDIIIQAFSENRKEFNIESSVVETSFNSNLTGFETEDIWRFVIELIDDEEIDGYIEDLKGVITIFKVFDFEYYYKSPEMEKKKLILKSLRDGISILCEKFSVSNNFFEEAYLQTLSDGVKYRSKWGNEALSLGDLWQANIYLELDFGVSKISAVFKNMESGIVVEKILVNPKPNYMFFDRCLGRSFWDDEGAFCLESKNKKEIWKAKPE
ncbi:hypothetical protein [Persicobacter psychrovividus]|uniref:Uncharacterized protein n=1 Tax=Persicobacter psychrovividus TaxID=387638 RepID=A0ABM7VMN7_9BACT|nr:hypothetical protein PEPS_44650 [Persicobacter psychrovividus]